jgi:ubiquinone biosynthesis monooxygenase Coq7
MTGLPDSEPRQLGPIDRLLAAIGQGLTLATAEAPAASRPNPAEGVADTASLAAHERRHAAGLMRVNHAGEICAQALYAGQALMARDPALRAHLENAASEEIDHLAWCAERLAELGERPSLLSPLWYAGSFAIGALAGLFGDRASLGFVVETERQVEAHLDDHLAQLPPDDQRSRAIVRAMQAEERAHADAALARGAMALPEPVPRLMALAARVMKVLAYRL